MILDNKQIAELRKLIGEGYPDTFGHNTVKDLLDTIKDLEQGALVVGTAPDCTCRFIQADDQTRHFRGCPLREKYPSHAAEGEPSLREKQLIEMRVMLRLESRETHENVIRVLIDIGKTDKRIDLDAVPERYKRWLKRALTQEGGINAASDLRLKKAVEEAWGIIANVGGRALGPPGDWDTQSASWVEAAERWRDEYVTFTGAPKEAAPLGAEKSVETRERTLFEEELEEHRQDMEEDAKGYSGQHASFEVRRVRDAVRFLLAVAHQPLPVDMVPVDAVRERFDELEKHIVARQNASDMVLRRIEKLEAETRVDEKSVQEGLRERFAAADDDVCQECGHKRMCHEERGCFITVLNERTRGVPKQCDCKKFVGANEPPRGAPIGGILKDGIALRVSPEPRMFSERRKIVTLCGSTRFGKAFEDANLEETLKGNIVLSVGSTTHSDAELRTCRRCGLAQTPQNISNTCPMSINDYEIHRWMSGLSEDVKKKLDALHKDKIAMSDEILVLNVGRCTHCGGVEDHQFQMWGHADVCPHFREGYQGHGFEPYIGDSTKSEITYAVLMKKPVRFLNPHNGVYRIDDLACAWRKDSTIFEEDWDVALGWRK